jgi:hypothetical protein
MVDKGLGGRQYQKTTLASNLKRDYITQMMASFLLHLEYYIYILAIFITRTSLQKIHQLSKNVVLGLTVG